MILLPCIYFAFIGSVAYLTYLYAIYSPGIMQIRGLTGLMLYLGPILIGLILIFFMIKPLFAQRRTKTSTIELDPDQEPILENFVERICEAVRAPTPQSIAVDTQVNASASFDGGILGFIIGDLRLTIGLPLIAGMSVQSVGGILAHEFGHFSQGGGMRLTFIIRMINNWFTRVVYGRDSWDDSIEEDSQNADFRIMIVLQIARGCIFVARRILWCLMQVGHFASCYMSRQMEFNADSFAVRFSGSDDFSDTSDRISEIDLASQIALDQLREHYETKTLIDDLPSLIESCRKTLSDDHRAQIKKARTEHKTKLTDTHPSDSDRIAYAHKLNNVGVFSLTDPASMLFKDFEDTCREVTKHYYTEIIKIDTSQVSLVNNDDIQEAEKRKWAEIEAARKFHEGTINLELHIEPSELTMEDEETVSLNSYFHNLDRLRDFQFKREDFDQKVEKALKTKTSRYYDDHKHLCEDLSKQASETLSLAARLCLQHLKDAEKEAFAKDYELFRQVCSQAGDWFNVRAHVTEIAESLKRWQHAQPQSTAVTTLMRDHAFPVLDSVTDIPKSFGKTRRLPISMNNSKMTVAAFLTPPYIDTDHTVITALHKGNYFMEKYQFLYYRMLGRVAITIQETLKAIEADDTIDDTLEHSTS